MSLLHRYVFKSVLVTCLGGVLMFAFILLAGSVIKDMLSLLAEGQLSFLAFFKLISVLFPYVFVHALPLGLLTGVLLTMGRLSAQSEVTAMRSAGISIFRIASPVFVFAILGTTMALVVNFYYGPKAKTEYRRELATAVQKNPLGFVIEKTFVQDFPGFVFYVSEKEGEDLKDVWLWVLDENKRAKSFFRAQSGYFDLSEDHSSLNLVLVNGQAEARNRDDPEDFSRQRGAPSFSKSSFSLPLDHLLGRMTFNRKLSWMTFQELIREKARWETEIDRLSDVQREEAESSLLQVRMVFHEKFAMGFSVLSFTMIAVPMGIRAQRSETSANLFLALGLALAYYFLMMSIGWLEGMPHLYPDVLYWVPNIAFQAIGLRMFYKADRSA